MTPSKTPTILTAAKRAAPAPRDTATGGAVVPFVAGTPRRFRREADDRPRGQILLFTGVRYERLPDTGSVPQRRRS